VGDIVRLYESLGFDVLAEAVPAEDAGDDCRDCRIIALQGFRTIYTRPRAR
jgi:EAL domain-containing protein (putative c-di-GMP-specific phosphodiesterase class I)